jgi:hypothetical protein
MHAVRVAAVCIACTELMVSHSRAACIVCVEVEGAAFQFGAVFVVVCAVLVGLLLLLLLLALKRGEGCHSLRSGAREATALHCALFFGSVVIKCMHSCCAGLVLRWALLLAGVKLGHCIGFSVVYPWVRANGPIS